MTKKRFSPSGEQAVEVRLVLSQGAAILDKNIDLCANTFSLVTNLLFCASIHTRLYFWDKKWSFMHAIVVLQSYA